ncbi:MAG: nuclear transport factor 2 family protein [Acidimicrobiales bacterium]
MTASGRPPHPPAAVVRDAYAAFNARDIEAALALMQPDVDWPNELDHTRAHGHAAVRAYWTRQFGLIDPDVEPTNISADDDGRLVVDVHQVVRDFDGNVQTDVMVRHVYLLRDGLVARMDVLRT